MLNWANSKSSCSKRACIRLQKLHSFCLGNSMKRPKGLFLIYSWNCADVEAPLASADTDGELWMVAETQCPPAGLDKLHLPLCFCLVAWYVARMFRQREPLWAHWVQGPTDNVYGDTKLALQKHWWRQIWASEADHLPWQSWCPICTPQPWGLPSVGAWRKNWMLNDFSWADPFAKK